MAFIGVKGTNDFYGKEAQALTYISNVFKAVCELYGYEPIETPILEHTDVFDRATGESSDVVRKEMYTFLDKGNRSVTMRPEGTAGVIRAIVEHKLYATNDLPLKFYYAGPAFRYERPQLGRFRQFTQLGVETVGEDSPRLDAETICLAYQILSMLGFRNLKIKVNSIGDVASRTAYKKALREYFSERIEGMCEDCKSRLELNPMRILDCKVPSDQEIAKGAPKMGDYLTNESQERFAKTLSILASLGIEYEKDEGLVRGLDYYGEIVFEVHAISDDGKDYGALLGGGHYDGMIKMFGGPENVDHGVGFALGLERVAALMKDNGMLEGVARNLDIFLMPIGENVLDEAFILTSELRGLGYSVEMPFSPLKMGAMFKKAERKGAKVALILGEDELKNGKIQLKIMDSKEQKEVDIDSLPQTLDGLFDEEEEECECSCHHDGHQCHCHDHEGE